MRPALMIIDLQKAFCDSDSRESMSRAASTINRAIPLFREMRLPVIWVQHIDASDGSEPGKEGFDFIDELKPVAEDYRVHKRYRNCFNKTDCLEIVKEEKVDTLIVTGFCAEYCIQGTCVGALDLDLLPIILKDGIASGSEENRKVIEGINEIISIRALRKALE
jgi:nicotinamidase-related amidase